MDTSSSSEPAGRLDGFARRRDITGIRLHVPEDNLVVIIPSVELFSTPGSLFTYLDEMKPALLREELLRYNASESELGFPITVETFDALFSITVRAFPSLITNLPGFGPDD